MNSAQSAACVNRLTVSCINLPNRSTGCIGCIFLRFVCTDSGVVVGAVFGLSDDVVLVVFAFRFAVQKLSMENMLLVG